MNISTGNLTSNSYSQGNLGEPYLSELDVKNRLKKEIPAIK
jgi:hypothetical protein